VAAGVVYFPSRDGHVYTFDVNTGKEKWRYRVASRMGCSPVLAGGILYAGGSDGVVVALDAATGKPRWRSNVAKGWIQGSVAVGDGVVYVGSADRCMYALH